MASTLATLAKYGATPINRQSRNILSYKQKQKKNKASKSAQTKAGRKTFKREMVSCPVCLSPVSARRLQRHLRKVHQPSQETGASSHGVSNKTRLSTSVDAQSKL